MKIAMVKPMPATQPTTPTPAQPRPCGWAQAPSRAVARKPWLPNHDRTGGTVRGAVWNVS